MASRRSGRFQRNRVGGGCLSIQAVCEQSERDRPESSKVVPLSEPACHESDSRFCCVTEFAARLAACLLGATSADPGDCRKRLYRPFIR
jgi:hypothetical protein